MIVIIPLIATKFPAFYEIEKKLATVDRFAMKSIILVEQLTTDIPVLWTSGNMRSGSLHKI